MSAKSKKGIMKKIIIVCIATFMLSCSKDSPSDIEPDFIEIAKDILNGGGTEGIVKSNLVIKDISTWTSIINQMDLINKESAKFTETDIDFNRYQVIAVFDKVYGNGGYSIDITNIKENESNLIIKVENLNKGGLLSIITQPYHIVKIKKTDKNIVFEQES